MVKQKSIYNSCEGFTLVEMLIAMIIIGTLSVIVIVNFKGFNVNTALNSETEQLSAAFRQAQLAALTGQTRGGVRPSGGWGLHAEQCVSGSCQYTIFADSWPAGAPNGTYDNGFDGTSIEIVIKEGIEIFSVTPASGGALDVVFSTPEAGVYFNGAQAAAEGVVVLQHAESGTQRIIRIDQVTGRINAE